MATFDDFLKIDISVGKVIEVEDFPEANNPSYKMKIDFGKEIGIKKSSAQFVENHTKEDLKGKLVVCVVNFPPKKIGSETSEVLTLGLPDENGKWVAVSPEKEVPLGGRLK